LFQQSLPFLFVVELRLSQSQLAKYSLCLLLSHYNKIKLSKPALQIKLYVFTCFHWVELQNSFQSLFSFFVWALR
jgi:hypothetical protein